MDKYNINKGDALDFDDKKSLDVLKFALQNGIIDMGKLQSAQEQMANHEREKLLNQHKYKISYNKSKDLYFTYVDDPSKKGGRRQITKKNKKDLEDIIIKTVKDNMAVTIEDVFEEYLELKKDSGLKQATIDRYRSVFQRHFIQTNNHRENIKKLSPEWWCDFIESEVGREELTAKGISGLKSVTKGILKRAKRKRLIDFTYSIVFDDLDIKPYQKYTENDRQVFTQKELPLLVSYLIEHPDVHNLCILLMIVSGIRCGELATLMFSDFITATSFNVRRTETRYKADDGYICAVSPFPKTMAANRTVIIPEDYSWITDNLRKMRPFAEYLSTNDKGERMTTNAIRKRLYRICEWLGFDYRKSPHKCRKTYISILLDGGFDHNFVLSQAGHTSITTSEAHYHYDRKSEQEKQNKVNNIIDFKVS